MGQDLLTEPDEDEEPPDEELELEELDEEPEELDEEPEELDELLEEDGVTHVPAFPLNEIPLLQPGVLPMHCSKEPAGHLYS